VEARGLSWPAWRKKNGDGRIPQIVQAILARYANSTVRITLSGHSGGGSFIFGYINAHETIPSDVVRIAFLDANYAYETEKHLQKFVTWLSASREHRLCVLAYRDDLARWEGKPFVTVTGGTGGRSKAMQADLAQHFKLRHSQRGDLRVAKALGGRVQFLVHDNPAGIILHTVQVEKNGFIHSMLTGTKHEGRGYEYLGPRAYGQWIGGGDDA
jgi:hypothetical protein